MMQERERDKRRGPGRNLKQVAQRPGDAFLFNGKFIVMAGRSDRSKWHVLDQGTGKLLFKFDKVGIQLLHCPETALTWQELHDLYGWTCGHDLSTTMTLTGRFRVTDIPGA